MNPDDKMRRNVFNIIMELTLKFRRAGVWIKKRAC